MRSKNGGRRRNSSPRRKRKNSIFIVKYIAEKCNYSKTPFYFKFHDTIGSNDIKRDDKIIRSEYQQACRAFNLPFILSWLQFGFLMPFAKKKILPFLLPFAGVFYTSIGQHHFLQNHRFRYLSCTCHQWRVGRLWRPNQEINSLLDQRIWKR